MSEETDRGGLPYPSYAWFEHALPEEVMRDVGSYRRNEALLMLSVNTGYLHSQDCVENGLTWQLLQWWVVDKYGDPGPMPVAERDKPWPWWLKMLVLVGFLAGIGMFGLLVVETERDRDAQKAAHARAEQTRKCATVYYCRPQMQQ